MVPHSDLAPPEPPMGPATPKAPPTPKQEVEGKETPRQEAAESGESDPDAGEKETPEEEESTLLHPEADSGEADAAVAAAAAAAEAAEAAEAAPSPEAAVSSKEAEKTLLPEAPEAEALAETVDQPQLEEDESTLPQPEAEPVEAADAASPMEEAVSAEASPTPVPEHAEPAEPSVEATSAEGPTEEAPAEVPEVPSSPRSSSLFSLAEQLQLQQGDEPRRIVEILEELERIPVTVELLRQTQLGVISQPFKDHDDADVRKVAKRLRRSWKDLIAATAEANEAPMPPAEEVSMPDTAVAPEAQHGMVPPEKEEELTVEEEADKLLKEMEEINTKMDSPKLQRKVGGTEDATELFGSTPREPQLEHVGAPKHLFRPSSASSAAPRRHSAVQDADEVFGKSPRDGAWETPEHVGAPKHLLRPTSAQARRPSLEEVLSGSAPPAKGTFARAATLSLNPLPPTPLPSTAAPPPPKQLPKAPAPPKQLPAAKQAPQLPAPKALPAMPAKAEKVLPKAEAEMEQKVSEAAPAPEPPTVGELAPEPPKVAEAPTTPPKVSEPSPVQSAQPAEPAVSMAPRVMALLPPAPLPPAPAPAPASAPPPPPKTGSPSRKKPSMAPLPPVPEIEQAQAEQEASSESSEELLPETPVAKHAAQAAPAPPTAAGYPKMAEAPAAPGGGAGYPQGELPARPQPQMNAGLPSAARRQRAELVSNLQYLCRLFLETREQLYAAHEGTETEANCDGLREELDAVRFRRLLEETLGQSHGAMPKPLIRLLRSFGRRALYGRRRSPYGRRAFAQFQQACTGQGPKGFVLGAVPQILRLMDRLVDEGRRTMPDAVEVGGDDPWLDGMPEETEKGRGLPDWEKLDGILSEPQNLESLQAEADAFLAETSMPKPLCLSKAERAETTAEPPDSGSFAPRGRRPATAVPGDDGADAKQGRRLFASVGPYYSCDPELLLKVAKAPLPNLDTLVNSLVPGAELTTEGLLLQLADEELVVMAYALEQVAEAASRRLVKDLEVRDELRSTCMHRREYLQLLEGALSRN